MVTFKQFSIARVAVCDVYFQSEVSRAGSGRSADTLWEVSGLTTTDSGLPCHPEVLLNFFPHLALTNVCTCETVVITRGPPKGMHANTVNRGSKPWLEIPVQAKVTKRSK